MKDDPDKKIKTKEDLIRFIQRLPEDWLPTKCIWWEEPQTIALLEDGGSVKEITNRIEIELRGPTVTREFKGGKL